MAAITAYGVEQGRAVRFPIKEASDLNITENAFLSLKDIFTLLDNVFRGAGNQCIPQKHSTVAAHKEGLVNLAKEKIFDPLRDLHASENIHELEKNFNLMALTHDAPEVIGEISTFASRLVKADGEISEDDREKLETKISYIIFYLALKATKANDPQILIKPITDMQEFLPKQKDQYARYNYAKKEFVDKLFAKVQEELKENPDLKKDHEILYQAQLRMDGDSSVEDPSKEHFTGILTKLLDKLESIYYVSHDQVGDYSDLERNKVQLGCFNTPQKLFNKLSSIQDLTLVQQNIIKQVKSFYNSCVDHFKSRSSSFNDFQNI